MRLVHRRTDDYRCCHCCRTPWKIFPSCASQNRHGSKNWKSCFGTTCRAVEPLSNVRTPWPLLHTRDLLARLTSSTVRSPSLFRLHSPVSLAGSEDEHDCAMDYSTICLYTKCCTNAHHLPLGLCGCNQCLTSNLSVMVSFHMH